MSAELQEKLMKRTRSRAIALSGTAILLWVAGGAEAIEGSYEINQDCVAVGCFSGDGAGYPVTIANAGRYVLTTNLAPPGDASTGAISITVSNVDLDLNGHTIDGGGSCTGTPVTTCSGALGSTGVNISAINGLIAHVHDGTVRGFSNFGIRILPGASGTLFDHLVVTENAFGGINVVGESTVVSTRIEYSSVDRNGQSGIAPGNGVNSRILVENCEVSGNLGSGIVGGAGSSMVNNRISSNGAFGVACVPAVTGVCALGRNSFYANATGGANPQFDVPVLRDMGGNVCLDDGTCP